MSRQKGEVFNYKLMTRQLLAQHVAEQELDENPLPYHTPISCQEVG